MAGALLPGWGGQVLPRVRVPTRQVLAALTEAFTLGRTQNKRADDAFNTFNRAEVHRKSSGASSETSIL